jgi:hypothetical protein
VSAFHDRTWTFIKAQGRAVSLWEIARLNGMAPWRACPYLSYMLRKGWLIRTKRGRGGRDGGSPSWFIVPPLSPTQEPKGGDGLHE